jgi:hypothetical protein
LLHSVLTCDYDFFAGRQALQDDCLSIVVRTNLDAAHRSLVVIAYDEGVEPARSMLDRVLGSLSIANGVPGWEVAPVAINDVREVRAAVDNPSSPMRAPFLRMF